MYIVICLHFLRNCRNQCIIGNIARRRMLTIIVIIADLRKKKKKLNELSSYCFNSVSWKYRYKANVTLFAIADVRKKKLKELKVPSSHYFERVSRRILLEGEYHFTCNCCCQKEK